MNIQVTYPPHTKKGSHRWVVLRIFRRIFLVVALCSVVVNLSVGGPAWSPVVLWSLWSLWTSVLSPSMVEFNRISQMIKNITNVCVLLILIDVLLAPGWAIRVVPTVCFGGLILTGVLFFTDYQRQKQNMLPMLLLILAAIIATGLLIAFFREQSGWPMFVMGAVALCLLLSCIARLGTDFIRELKKRFHIR